MFGHTWITRDGRQILIRDMENTHLENLLNFIARKYDYDFQKIESVSSMKKLVYYNISVEAQLREFSLHQFWKDIFRMGHYDHQMWYDEIQSEWEASILAEIMNDDYGDR